MAKQTDWLPRSRSGQLGMAKNWVTILASRATAWGVPEAVTQELTGSTTAAGEVLSAAMNDVTRTPVVTAHCKEVFDHLTAVMRDIKKRYFFVPPLTEADLVALGLKVPDGVPTPSGDPTAQVTVETFLVGRHELGLRIVYVTGSPDDPANKEYRVWYKVVPPGGKAPESPKDLTELFTTKRKRDLITFEYEASGSTVYFAVKVGNGGKEGPWGPISSALIP